MPSKDEVTKAAVKDLIIGFGVLEGLWIYAEVNPFEGILKAFVPLLQGTQFEWYNTFAWMLIYNNPYPPDNNDLQLGRYDWHLIFIVGFYWWHFYRKYIWYPISFHRCYTRLLFIFI